MTQPRLSRNELLDKIGEGGMGVLYRAQDPRLGRVVAVKVLHEQAVPSVERRERFLQEARAVSSLNHPNIVTVYDVGDEAGAPFIAMEFLQGRTLREHLAESTLEIDRAVDYAGQIADALAAAHRAGIVHRDVKPANIMILESGRVKVLDFGLAKLAEPIEIEIEIDAIDPSALAVSAPWVRA